MSTALERLAEKIEQASKLGLLPDDWRELALAAVAEVGDQWLPERVFRLRTGASDRWCREHFERYEANGLARKNERRRREWHIHARLPKQAPRDAEALKREIVESFEQRAS